MSISTRSLGFSVDPTAWNELVTAINTLRTDVDGLLAARTAYSFSAGDFTANGAMTWTLQSGDVDAASYILRGHHLHVHFSLITTTVAGTPNTTLRIKIPASKVATRIIRGSFWYYDNGTFGTGYWQVAASGTNLELWKADQSNWTASTNLTHIYLSAEFEVN